MSEPMLKIPLKELAALRLVCERPGCGSAFEVTPPRVALLTELRCPGCGGLLHDSPDADQNPLRNLARALQAAQLGTGHCRVEFLVSTRPSPL